MYQLCYQYWCFTFTFTLEIGSTYGSENLQTMDLNFESYLSLKKDAGLKIVPEHTLQSLCRVFIMAL